MTKNSSLWLMMWKLDCFSQNIGRVQIGLRTGIFGQFLDFDDLQAFAYSWQKFRVWGSWCGNWTIFVRIFEGVKLVLELEFFVSFCILIIFNHLLTYHRKFQVWGSLNENWSLLARIFEGVILVWAQIFGQFSYFSNLQHYTNRW